LQEGLACFVAGRVRRHRWQKPARRRRTLLGHASIDVSCVPGTQVVAPDVDVMPADCDRLFAQGERLGPNDARINAAVMPAAPAPNTRHIGLLRPNGLLLL
jgi:hypothetical protein